MYSVVSFLFSMKFVSDSNVVYAALFSGFKRPSLFFLLLNARIPSRLVFIEIGVDGFAGKVVFNFSSSKKATEFFACLFTSSEKWSTALLLDNFAALTLVVSDRQRLYCSTAGFYRNFFHNKVMK